MIKPVRTSVKHTTKRQKAFVAMMNKVLARNGRHPMLGDEPKKLGNRAYRISRGWFRI